ncbi:MAG: helix-turn-helix transcriptional regulator [Proteobacteria bacterium]|nr:helix-turn-helix transcriptional regulator [Pseudomonadota bacterium]
MYFAMGLCPVPRDALFTPTDQLEWIGMRAPNASRTAVVARGRAGAADIAIGRRIRSLRLRRGLTQEDLAHRLGVSCQQLQKYEGGENRVSAARAVEIAQHLEVAVGALLADTDDEPVATTSNDKPTPEDMIELMQLFRNIVDPEARHRLLDLARFFSQ